MVSPGMPTLTGGSEMWPPDCLSQPLLGSVTPTGVLVLPDTRTREPALEGSHQSPIEQLK